MRFIFVFKILREQVKVSKAQNDNNIKIKNTA